MKTYFLKYYTELPSLCSAIRKHFCCEPKFGLSTQFSPLFFYERKAQGGRIFVNVSMQFIETQAKSNLIKVT